MFNLTDYRQHKSYDILWLILRNIDNTKVMTIYGKSYGDNTKVITRHHDLTERLSRQTMKL